jgi:6-phosphogluconolactonase
MAIAEKIRLRVFPDPATLAAHAAEQILGIARGVIAARGVFHLVLAGGRTPEAVYTVLGGAWGQWEKWQIWFGDERCLVANDPERNDSMARRVWLDRVPIPRGHIHSIAAEHGPEVAAARYAEQLKGIGDFDLVLLGLGEDGHTASLFPGQAPGDRPGDPDVLAVHGAPKWPAARVSLSAARLSRAARVLFLASGEGKRQAVEAWRRGDDIPARHIAPAGGVDMLLDTAAAGEAADATSLSRGPRLGPIGEA